MSSELGLMGDTLLLELKARIEGKFPSPSIVGVERDRVFVISDLFQDSRDLPRWEVLQKAVPNLPHNTRYVLLTFAEYAKMNSVPEYRPEWGIFYLFPDEQVGTGPFAEIPLGPPEPCLLGSVTVPSFRSIAIREILMPKDLNHHGVAFGGWVLSKMDLAGAHEARQHTKHDVVTRYMNGIEFTSPIQAGDVVTFYTSLVKIGNTSITVRVEVEASRDGQAAPVAVSGAEFVYVTVSRNEAGDISKVPVR